MIAEWHLAAVEAAPPTLNQLRARYESAIAWEQRTRTALDQEREAYARALLAGQPGDAELVRTRSQNWRHAARDVRRAEYALTEWLLGFSLATAG